jgi:hypothetical protein
VIFCQNFEERSNIINQLAIKYPAPTILESKASVMWNNYMQSNPITSATVCPPPILAYSWDGSKLNCFMFGCIFFLSIDVSYVVQDTVVRILSKLYYCVSNPYLGNMIHIVMIIYDDCSCCKMGNSNGCDTLGLYIFYIVTTSVRVVPPFFLISHIVVYIHSTCHLIPLNAVHILRHLIAEMCSAVGIIKTVSWTDMCSK